MLLLLLTFTILLSLGRAQTYCQRGKGFLLDSAGQCLLSSDYDVANCCYVCPVQNSSGYFSMCGSLYDLGFATCAQSGALTARQNACSAIGGSISSGAFMCACNGGTNVSQTNYTSLAPTAPQPTATPTGSGVNTVCFLYVTALFAVFLFGL